MRDHRNRYRGRGNRRSAGLSPREGTVTALETLDRKCPLSGLVPREEALDLLGHQ